jgi:hypothetical protein
MSADPTTRRDFLRRSAAAAADLGALAGPGPWTRSRALHAAAK